MLRKTYISFIVILCGVALCWASQKIETQVGPFNLSAAPVTESQLVSQFGEGYVRIDKVGDKILGKSRTFYSPGGSVWVEIQFSHVLDKNLERVAETIIITKRRLCDEKFKPKKSFGPLITAHGVKIGDSLEKVIETYGQPSISIEVGKEKRFSVLIDELKISKGRVLRYLTDQPGELSFAEFYFNEEGLHSFLISESE